MRNRMQDLDFEQTVAFDSVKDFEFTRRAAQRFRQVVSLDGFEDEDADVIFHYLYKEMELVSFGDYLKRYVYERAELEEPFSQVPQEVYREIVVESFKETYTPKSMSPTSAKLSSLVNNWLTQASVKRETVFLLGFGLRMSTEDVSDFLTRVLREQDFDFHNPEEVIYWYCYRNHLGYYKAEEYKETYKQMTPVEKKTGEIVYGTGLCLDSEEKLLEYLHMDVKNLVACGDGYNDLTMIEYAGVGVAMANAQEIVKEHADYVTLSNDEDGLVPVIDKFILGE